MADPRPGRGPDPCGAFVPGGLLARPSTGQGPLHGLDFAVKDLIDVAGTVTGGGNPDWAAAHAPAAQDAPAVAALCRAGARLVGKTITDELAFSLEGENAHHGTPLNPQAPDCLPGGSSSGSAVAVACGQVDFALGTDTGGSVRVPAAFCGLYGMRPSHGLVSLQGVIPFAPSLDTVGWMARSGDVLQRVGDVLLPAGPAAALSPPRLEAPMDLWQAVAPACAQALWPLAERLGVRPSASTALNAPLEDWLQAYTCLQGDEIRQSLGPWITEHRPRFGPTVAPRFASVFDIPAEQVQRWGAWRARQARRLSALLADDTVWVLPTTPTPPLSRQATGDERGRFYSVALPLNAVAGLAGLPQVTLPLGQWQGRPLGLSLIAGHGRDRELLRLAATITPA